MWNITWFSRSHLILNNKLFSGIWGFAEDNNNNNNNRKHDGTARKEKMKERCRPSKRRPRRQSSGAWATTNRRVWRNCWEGTLLGGHDKELRAPDLSMFAPDLSRLAPDMSSQFAPDMSKYQEARLKLVTMNKSWFSEKNEWCCQREESLLLRPQRFVQHVSDALQQPRNADRDKNANRCEMIISRIMTTNNSQEMLEKRIDRARPNIEKEGGKNLGFVGSPSQRPQGGRPWKSR